MSFEEGRKIIDKIREEKIKEMLETGKHYIVTKGGIPEFQVTEEEVVDALETVKEMAPKYGTTAEEVYKDIKVHDIATHKVYTVIEFMTKERLARWKERVEPGIKEMAKIPEGVEVVKYEFFSTTDTDMAETMFDAMGTGKYEFKSAVNIGTMVRTVMYERGEKTGTPIRVFVHDKDMAWHLQQLIDWVYKGQAKVLAVKKEDKTLNVAFRMEGIKAPPPKEKLFYSFKKTDGWDLVGEEKP